MPNSVWQSETFLTLIQSLQSLEYLLSEIGKHADAYFPISYCVLQSVLSQFSSYQLYVFEMAFISQKPWQLHHLHSIHSLLICSTDRLQRQNMHWQYLPARSPHLIKFVSH